MMRDYEEYPARRCLLGVGFHRRPVQIVAGSRADDRAGAQDDLTTQEWNADAITPTERTGGDLTSALSVYGS